jgi:hypothetical protein
MKFLFIIEPLNNEFIFLISYELLFKYKLYQTKYIRINRK